ncbi:MAG: ATP-binding cassette domain-containing protein [Hyphomicrobiales bacterium]|nr:ATP-binding cassette domain-containing protein [Hyphomicrobiales bacterium]MCY4049229.1 ATP-binding cassette domain-containing protein [Hyphomicrobiales bacterium]MCY4052686.1 ATP-binding cassette domain-containing protein [Hyphomicrobiales bacterium]
MAFMELKGVHKRFGEKIVLDGIDLEVERGSSLVILGGSGSGKSVMLRCILGLLHPEDGGVWIDGRETTGLRGRAREEILSRIGMLFQNAALFDSLRVWENVAFGLIQGRGMPSRQAKKIAIEKLESVGLGEMVGELRPSELSGGMQKRVALARAIAGDPDILFFDEPTTGLDPITGAIIDRLIVDTVKRVGATALSITHDINSARTIADKIAMLYKGRILWHGEAARLDESGNEYVDQFVHGRTEGPIEMELYKL